MRQVKQFQIGKKGLTVEFIEQVKTSFKTSKSARISLLKSATRDKEEAKKIGDELVESLGKNYIYKKIGYTLVVKKMRKART